MDRYVHIRPLGKGGFGMASLVHPVGHPSKVLVAKQIPAPDDESLHVAQHEATLLAACAHPNIIRHVETLVINDKPSVKHHEPRSVVVIMEYAAGGDVGQRISKLRVANAVARGNASAAGSVAAPKQAFMPESEVLSVISQACLALAHLHSKRVLHRDIKPANIFLTSAGIVKLGDMGVARRLGGTAELAMTQIGTPYYLSPELARGKPYGRKSDMWALGVTAYEMCALAPPFNAPDIPSLLRKIVTCKYPSLPPAARYSKGLTSLVSSLLSRDPKTRPSAKELLAREPVRSHLQLLLSKTLGARELLAGARLVGAVKEDYETGGAAPAPSAIGPPVPKQAAAQGSSSHRKPSLPGPAKQPVLPNIHLAARPRAVLQPSPAPAPAAAAMQVRGVAAAAAAGSRQSSSRSPSPHQRQHRLPSPAASAQYGGAHASEAAQAQAASPVRGRSSAATPDHRPIGAASPPLPPVAAAKRQLSSPPKPSQQQQQQPQSARADAVVEAAAERAFRQHRRASRQSSGSRSGSASPGPRRRSPAARIDGQSPPQAAGAARAPARNIPALPEAADPLAARRKALQAAVAAEQKRRRAEVAQQHAALVAATEDRKARAAVGREERRKWITEAKRKAAAAAAASDDSAALDAASSGGDGGIQIFVSPSRPSRSRAAAETETEKDAGEAGLAERLPAYKEGLFNSRPPRVSASSGITSEERAASVVEPSAAWALSSAHNLPPSNRTSTPAAAFEADGASPSTSRTTTAKDKQPLPAAISCSFTMVMRPPRAAADASSSSESGATPCRGICGSRSEMQGSPTSASPVGASNASNVSLQELFAKRMAARRAAASKSRSIEPDPSNAVSPNGARPSSSNPSSAERSPSTAADVGDCAATTLSALMPPTMEICAALLAVPSSSSSVPAIPSTGGDDLTIAEERPTITGVDAVRSSSALPEQVADISVAPDDVSAMADAADMADVIAWALQMLPSDSHGAKQDLLAAFPDAAASSPSSVANRASGANNGGTTAEIGELSASVWDRLQTDISAALSDDTINSLALSSVAGTTVQSVDAFITPAGISQRSVSNNNESVIKSPAEATADEESACEPSSFAEIVSAFFGRTRGASAGEHQPEPTAPTYFSDGEEEEEDDDDYSLGGPGVVVHNALRDQLAVAAASAARPPARAHPSRQEFRPLGIKFEI